MSSKTNGFGLESFFVGRSRPVAVNSLTPSAGFQATLGCTAPSFVRRRPGPGPLHREFFCPSERLGSCNKSFSSLDGESDGHVSFASQFNSSMDSLDDSELICILTWIYRAKA